MSAINKDQAKGLRNAFECWQQDYDPAEDKEQYDMFGLGVVAMDALLASLEAEPVAWMLLDPESGHSVATKAGFTLAFYKSKGWEVTPLYTYMKRAHQAADYDAKTLTITLPDTSSKAFEIWVRRRYGSRYDLTQDIHGHYRREVVKRMFEVWCHCRGLDVV